MISVKQSLQSSYLVYFDMLLKAVRWRTLLDKCGTVEIVPCAKLVLHGKQVDIGQTG